VDAVWSTGASVDSPAVSLRVGNLRPGIRRTRQPSAGRESNLGCVRVLTRSLPADVTEVTLIEVFSDSLSCALTSVRVCRDMATHRPRGHGYVGFHDARDAERALEPERYCPGPRGAVRRP
jgi:RNA recognition motif-containing protein